MVTPHIMMVTPLSYRDGYTFSSLLVNNGYLKMRNCVYIHRAENVQIQSPTKQAVCCALLDNN